MHGYCLIGSSLIIIFKLCQLDNNKLHPADPTKYREGASNRGYLVLRTILMHGRVYGTIFYALDYRSVSTFHRQSRYGAKNLFFSAVEAVVCVSYVLR